MIKLSDLVAAMSNTTVLLLASGDTTADVNKAVAAQDKVLEALNKLNPKLSITRGQEGNRETKRRFSKVTFVDSKGTPLPPKAMSTSSLLLLTQPNGITFNISKQNPNGIKVNLN